MHPLTKSSKILLKVLSVLSIVTIIGWIPMLLLARKSYVQVDERGLKTYWLTELQVAWSEVTAVTLKGKSLFIDTNNRKLPQLKIPFRMYQNHAELLKRVESYSGLTLAR